MPDNPALQWGTMSLFCVKGVAALADAWEWERMAEFRFAEFLCN